MDDELNSAERQRAYTALAWMVALGIAGVVLTIGGVAWAVWKAVGR